MCLIENEAEIGLFENGKVCLHRKNELPHVQHQQAISIYFFLEGLGFNRNCIGFGSGVLTESFERKFFFDFVFQRNWLGWAGWAELLDGARLDRLGFRVLES